jgi:hypothetical protein
VILHVPVWMATMQKKSAVLVLVWCYKATGDREQDLWRYWLPEGCVKQWYEKSRCDHCLCKKCGLEEQWSSDIAVNCTLGKHPDIQCDNTRFVTLWLLPLSRMSIDVADSALLHLLFSVLGAFFQAILLLT